MRTFLIVMGFGVAFHVAVKAFAWWVASAMRRDRESRIEEMRRDIADLKFHTKLHAELTRPAWDRPGGAWVAHPDPGACRCGWRHPRLEQIDNSNSDMEV